MDPTNRVTLTVLSLFWAALVPVPRPMSGAQGRPKPPAEDGNDASSSSSSSPSSLRRNLVWYSRGLVLLLLLGLVPDDPIDGTVNSRGKRGGGVTIALWVATAWMVRVVAGLAAVVAHRLLLWFRQRERGSYPVTQRGRRRDEADELTASPRDRPSLPRPQRTGGPLGPGGAKIWEAMAGATWVVRSGLVFSGQSPAAHYYYYLSWGKPVHEQPTHAWVGVAILCLAVNGVLYGWSRFHVRRNQTLQHQGVADVVRSSVGRSLQWRDRTTLLYWAVANAICEEVTSRGVWRTYFEALLLRCITADYFQHSPKRIRLYSNLCQAAVFGMGHYHGIPSGLVGVGLSFLYGLVMGGLVDYNGGLGLAIIAHSVADFYIFAAVARMQLQHQQVQSALRGR